MSLPIQTVIYNNLMHRCHLLSQNLLIFINIKLNNNHQDHQFHLPLIHPCFLPNNPSFLPLKATTLDILSINNSLHYQISTATTGISTWVVRKFRTVCNHNNSSLHKQANSYLKSILLHHNFQWYTHLLLFPFSINTNFWFLCKNQIQSYSSKIIPRISQS